MASCGSKIIVKSKDLNLKYMLEGGQSFRWKRVGETKVWIGVFADIVWKLSQSNDYILFTGYFSCHNIRDEKWLESQLSNYLRLDATLDQYYFDWSEKDVNFKTAAVKYNGIRILKQDPVENLFSFICSSNNNISRISQMVEKLCELYGEKICTIDSRIYYSFPHIDALNSPSVEGTLRQAGFGYRAKYISQTASMLSSLGGHKYLESLKQLPYPEAKQRLLQFPGVGPKVGDCICLMSLDHFQAVPVDTHVFQIACQFYLPHLKKYKSVTDRIYKEISDYFRQLYGPLAGWAHTILFCADLKKFQITEGKDEQEIISKRAKKRKTN